MFKNPFSFDGRIRRTEFGLSYIIYIAAALTLSFTAEAAGEIGSLLLLGYIPLVWFIWAQGAKRCHDRGNTGWFQIIPFYAFWMVFADSEIGENMYGPNPKGIGNSDEVDEIGEYLVK